MSGAHSCEVAIVGGGPAGMAAAVTLRSFDLDVCLIDEQPRLGGQIYRQPPAGFQVDNWLSGRLYAPGKALLRRAEGLTGLRHFAPATAWALFPSEEVGASGGRHHLLLEHGGELHRVSARSVLLAPGCYEMPVPFPGWHLPGVMSAGAIQTLLKSQRVCVGAKVMLAGSHPLLLVVAEQLLESGVEIAGVAFAQRLGGLWRSPGWPSAMLRGAGPLWHAAGTLARLRRAGIPVLLGHVVTEALGVDAVEAVRIRDTRFRRPERILTCDALGACYGFLVSSELARQAGARSSWVDGSGWVVEADQLMRTSVPGLSVGGEQTGVAGAEAAALSGELAGLGIACDAGRLSVAAADEQAAPLKKRLAERRRFAAWLASMASPDPDLLARLAERSALICRCEDITVGALADVLATDPMVTSTNTAKLLTRVGMGVCQGRMCEISVRRMIARRRGCSIEEVPGYVARPPAKPVPIALLASDPGARVA